MTHILPNLMLCKHIKFNYSLLSYYTQPSHDVRTTLLQRYFNVDVVLRFRKMVKRFELYYSFLGILTHNYPFSTNHTVINKNLAIVEKHLQRKPLHISNERLFSTRHGHRLRVKALDHSVTGLKNGLFI